MKRYIQFLTLVLAAAAISACAVKENATEDVVGKEIKFQAGIGSFQVKASDTAFEKGDEIGLFAEEPVSATNVRLTSDGESLTPETTLYWGLGQDVNQPVAFYAYYPYAAGTAAQFTFAVAADQSSAAAYAAADLMLASTAAAPADASVRLNFGHRMSRAIIQVKNNLNNAAVTAVSVSGVLLEADVDITVPSVTAKGQTATVKAASVTGADGTMAWAVILPPQTPRGLSINITLSDGNTYDIPATDAVLEEGYSYNVSAYLDQTISTIEFSAGITDWLESWIYNGKQNDPGVQPHSWGFSVDGNIYPMTEQEDGLWHVSFVADSWIGGNVVRDGYDQIWGCAIPNIDFYLDPSAKEAVEIPLAPDGYVYLYTNYGYVFDLTLDVKAKKLYAKALEPKWTLLGTGKFIDGFVTSAFRLPYEEIDVDVYVEEHTPNVYRIMDPYKNWSYKDWFNYSEGAYLEIVVKDNFDAYFKQGWLGLNDSDYGDFYGVSLVEENGWSYGYYGYYYENYGYIGFNSMHGLYMTNYGTYRANNEGYMSLTLPGYTRPFKYTSITDEFLNAWVDDSGRHFSANINVGMDIVKLRYGLYSGSLSREEVWGNNRDGLYYTQVMPEGTEVEIAPGYDNTVEFEVPATGTYTLVLCGEDKDGQAYGVFDYFWLLFDGDEAPAVDLSVSAAPAQPLSDIQAKAHVEFADPSELHVLVVPEDTWTAWGIPDDNVYDYVLSNGESKNVYDISSSAGVNYTIPALVPETSYRVMVAGTSNFGESAWAQAIVTTEPEPSFTSLGIGHYVDDFLEIGKADVEILKADTGAERYRVVAPYDQYWNENSGEDYYSGFHTAKIDCYVDDGRFVYDPYYIGYKVADYGDVRYYCYNPFTEAHIANNKVLQEGVFNIAPYAKIEGSNYYYNVTYNVGTIYLELPGYTYTPDAGAPKLGLKAGKSNLVEVPASSGVMVQTEKRPFTRHMLGTTAKVVEKDNTIQISAEPLKK